MSQAEFVSFSKRLVGLVKLSLVIENTTGLLIQMPVTAQAYRIGGADKYPMITRKRYIVDGQELDLEVPFIPGSSLKGRMRSLLELAHGLKLYTTDEKIWLHVRSLQAMKDFKDFMDDVTRREVVDELFGWAAANYDQILSLAEKEYKEQARQKVNEIFNLLTPTRLLFSDFFPTQDFVSNIRASSIADFLEEKPENRIDRVTSAADPREVVRVRPGVVFEGAINLLLFDIDNVKIGEYIDSIILGLKLIEETYIGSSGSRGYGRVKIRGREITVYRLDPQTKQLIQVDTITFRSLEELEKSKDKLKQTISQVFK